jgi:hypothetical protein
LLTQVSSKLEIIKEGEEATQRKPQLVFARLAKIPFQHDGDQYTAAKPMSTVELWFRYFDRDGDGVITFQEFKQTMWELRLRLTDEVHDGIQADGGPGVLMTDSPSYHPRPG